MITAIIACSKLYYEKIASFPAVFLYSNKRTLHYQLPG